MNDSGTGPRHQRDAAFRPHPRWPRLGSLIAITAVVLAGCGGSDDGTTATAESSGATPSPGIARADTAIPTSTPTDTPPTEPDMATAEPDTTTAASSPTGVVESPTRTYDFSAVGPVVADFVETQDLDGAALVVVERDDGIVHEEYWGDFDADRISLIASSSKMIVAGVLLALDDAGVLDIHAPVADVVDWGAANPAITPAQLLSNSSGLPGLFSASAYGPHLCQFQAAGTLQGCAETIFTSPDDDAEVVPPDTEFRYGGAPWQVAGAVAEVASGKSWTELIDKIYVRACGIESLAFNNHWAQFGVVGFDYPADFEGDPSTLQQTGNPNMEGGAYITAPDYGALLLMHLRDGRCNDAQVLSAAALDLMHSDRTGPTYESVNSYGMGWWVDTANGRITDPGAYGATPWLDLDDGYGAYIVIEADAATGNALAAALYPLVEAAIERSR